MSPALLYKEKHFPGLTGDLEPPGLPPLTLFCALSSASESLEGITSLNSNFIQPSLTQSYSLPLLKYSISECLHMNGTDAYVSELGTYMEFLVFCLLPF